MVDPAKSGGDRDCPFCGAKTSQGAAECWMCHGALDAAPPVIVAPPVAGRARRDANYQFSLASLMLLVTLSAVIFGAAALEPGLGIMLAMLAAPPLVFTAVTAARRRAREQPLTPRDKVVLFAGAFATFVVVLIAAGIAFFATCWVGFFTGATASEAMGARQYDPIGWGLLTGVVLGGIVGLVLAAWLLWRIIKAYRKRDR